MDDNQVIERFQTLNRERIKRLASLLPAKHRFFIDFLPLLFQTNSKFLPAYINLETPAGITDYQPNKQALDAAKKYHSAFSYKRHASHQYPIRGLYLVNENGIYNYTANATLVLWLIYAQALSDAQLTLLRQKAAAISTWAKAENIAIEIRLLDEAELTSEGISSYDLDRLYCCGLLLAGCEPRWWSEDINGKTQQHSSRYAKDTINFGAIAPLSSQAFFDLVAVRIDQAMEQGLESCLDLIYFNYLLKNYPKFDGLSPSLKQAIIDDESDPMMLDINTLKLQILKQNSTNTDSLALAQKSLYSRSKELLSKNIKQAQYPWRRKFIVEQVDIWQWHDDVTESLDQSIQSQYRKCLSLFQLARKQLANSLTVLLDFSKQHKLDSSSSMLQRKLQQKFDILFNVQADTLNQLPTAFSPRKAEEYAYLSRSKKSNDWYIDDRPESISKTPLYQHSSLLNVLAWAVNNQLISKATRLKVANETGSIKTNVIIELVQQLLRSSLNKNPNTLGLNQMDQRAEIQHVLLFANLEHQSSDTLSQHGLEMSSLQADPLNYANKKQNLVASIEGLIHSSLDQWHYFIFTGNDCLLQMLSAILHWQPTAQSALTASCWCHFGNHGQNISNRIENIYRNTLSHYTSNPENGEYVISLADRLYQLRWQEGLCDIVPLAKASSLLKHLNKSRDTFYKTAVDSMLDRNGLFSTLVNCQSSGEIKLFLLSERQQINLYIIDEMGSLFKQQFNDLTEETLTNHFHTFLTAMNRNGDPLSSQFFRIKKHAKSGFSLVKITVEKPTKKQQYLPVIVEMESPDESARCTIKCGPKTFSGAANESTLFMQVRDLLLSLRKANNNYSLYITQLTFKQQDTTTRDYFIQKQRLEYLLNKLSA